YGSNFCDIGVTVDERTNRVTIVSVIDNLMKGAAGQAVQNFNIMNGLSETAGLEFTPIYP
ncbi:N-acetyl-gamma-glutamyl-phosphate reductase, partial [Bacillus licheniformis]|nr:N-acetyl-gamma-glutamyl-phosphate reductase [Bacillus licheniformis]